MRRDEGLGERWGVVKTWRHCYMVHVEHHHQTITATILNLYYRVSYIPYHLYESYASTIILIFLFQIIREMGALQGYEIPDRRLPNYDLGISPQHSQQKVWR